MLAINIGAALVLFALRAGTVAEGERFEVQSREAALVFNNVMLCSILGIVLLGTLYPLVTESMGVKVSVGPPYFTPMSALFAVPMLVVLCIGPMLRWRRDSLGRFSKVLALPLGVAVVAAIGFALGGVTGLMPLIALSLSPGLAVACVLPLRGRDLRRAPLSLWGMVVAHVGIAVALFGMGADSAFTQQRLLAAHVGEATQLGPWRITLASIEPVAGPNWTALEADLAASYDGGAPVHLHPQSRTFWAPVQTTSVSALHTLWNGQLYTVLGEESHDATSAASPTGRWQLRLWWKPFVSLIWLGGVLVALGGVLAMVSRVRQDLKRRSARSRNKERKA